MSFNHNNEAGGVRSGGGIRRDDVEGGVFGMMAKFENFNGQTQGLWYDKEWNNTDRMVESSIEQNQEMINSSLFSQIYPLFWDSTLSSLA